MRKVAFIVHENNERYCCGNDTFNRQLNMRNCTDHPHGLSFRLFMN